MKPLFSVFIFVAICTPGLLSQGCSDAGACTIPAFQAPGIFEDTQKKNTFLLGVNGGSADHSIFALGAHIGFARKFGNSFSADTKLTYGIRSGNDISVSGFGDVFVTLNYRITSTFIASVGGKLPLSEADRTYQGLILPMDYQTSLGTPDLIVGITYNKNNWNVSLGYQHPLDQNQNVFIPSEWPAESPLKDFIQTGVYDRGGDVLMKISRTIPMQGNVTITPGLLPIYHIRNDVDYLTFEKVEIEGSAGLTLNATLLAEIPAGLNNQFNLSVGFPLIVREVRPDGLTRSFVIGVDYVGGF